MSWRMEKTNAKKSDQFCSISAENPLSPLLIPENDINSLESAENESFEQNLVLNVVSAFPEKERWGGGILYVSRPICVST